MRKVPLLLAGLAAGIGIALAVPASADVHPTPTATPVVTPTATPTPTPTVTPVVNPFAACKFTVSRVTTFDPNRGRFVVQFDPAIVCDGGTPFGRWGRPLVFDLVRG